MNYFNEKTNRSCGRGAHEGGVVAGRLRELRGGKGAHRVNRLRDRPLGPARLALVALPVITLSIELNFKQIRLNLAFPT